MFKRFATVILMTAMFLTFLPALAGDLLPDDVSDYLLADERSDYRIIDHCIIENYCFVATKHENGTNCLFGFKQTEDGWDLYVRTEKALPQGEGVIRIGNSQGSDRLVDGYHYTLPTLSIGRESAKFGDFDDMGVSYILQNGRWMLEDVFHKGDDQVDSFFLTLGADSVTYYAEYEARWPRGTVKATVQRDLRYVNLSALPTTYAAAREKLTQAPELPGSDKLAAQEIKFTGGRKYPVYSAPDETSLRGANGKAIVSTNSWIQVFGREGDWILIQYSIDAKHYRFGYIDAKALPKSAQVPDLTLDAEPAWSIESVTLTDDPLYSNNPLLTLPEGAPLTWLATLGDWAYVESSSGDHLRGFVPAASLTRNRVFNLVNHPRDNGQVVFSGQADIAPDGLLTLTVSPIAVNPAALQMLDTLSGDLLLTLTKGADGLFTGTAMLPEGLTSLTLLPLDDAGAPIEAGRIRMEW